MVIIWVSKGSVNAVFCLFYKQLSTGKTMSLLEFIREAPCLAVSNITDLKLLLQRQTTSDTTPCVKVSVDFGPEYTHVLPWQPNEFIFFDFFVQGDFLLTDEFPIGADTSKVLPMPVTSQTLLCVRGKVVVAVLSKQVRKDYWRGYHRLGDWIVEPDALRVRFVPKDYVFQKHLELPAYNSRTDCSCCPILSRTEAWDTTQANLKLQSDLAHAVVYETDEACVFKVVKFGPDVVERFMDTANNYKPISEERDDLIRKTIQQLRKSL